MSEIEELSDEELLTEYRRTVEYRTEESLIGQVTPHEMEYKEALEDEILERM